MGSKVIFAPRAIADLEEISRHIAQDDADAAVRVGYALIDRVRILEDFPFLGLPYPKKPGVRKLVSRPYLIFLSSPSSGGTRRRASVLARSTGNAARFRIGDLQCGQSPRDPL